MVLRSQARLKAPSASPWLPQRLPAIHPNSTGTLLKLIHSSPDIQCSSQATHLSSQDIHPSSPAILCNNQAIHHSNQVILSSQGTHPSSPAIRPNSLGIPCSNQVTHPSSQATHSSLGTLLKAIHSSRAIRLSSQGIPPSSPATLPSTDEPILNWAFQPPERATDPWHEDRAGERPQVA